MSLSPPQLDVARQVYSMARGSGLPHQRALELVAAAYAESGLNPRATNKSSGAAGLFQLLSSGYRTRAQQSGGLYDIGANTRAILPDYLKYWQQHPNAGPGEAGRDVERSGQGAGFYSSPLASLAGLSGAAGAPPTPAGGVSPAGGPGLQSPGLQDFGNALINAIGHHSSLLPVLALARQAQGGVQGGGRSPGGPAAMSFGSYNAPSAGKVDSRLLALSHNFGLKITSGFRDPARNTSVGGSPTSLHMSGEAVDVAPSQNATKLAYYAYSNPNQFREFFGPVGWYIKNGAIHKGQFPGHGDHFHISLTPSS